MSSFPRAVANVLELKFVIESSVVLPVLPVKTGIQAYLKTLDSGSR